METILSVFSGIFNNLLSKPQYFMALLVFIGYLLLRKSFLESVGGALKAAIGYMILQVGSSGMVKGFTPLLNGLISKFGLTAAVVDSNIGFAAANAAIESIGMSLSSTMMVLLIGFIVNILLVMVRKVSKVRTIFTTGHIMVKQAGFITWLVFFSLPQFRNTVGVVIIGILIGLYWAVFSNLTVEATQRLTDGKRFFAIGHSQMLAVWFADLFAPKLGNKEDSIDNIKLPKSLSLLSDNIIGTSVVMLVMFGVFLSLIGSETMMLFDEAGMAGTPYFLYIVTTALSFTVNFVILQTGVKMLVGEISASFEGISDRLIKGSVPAVDCAASFGFAHSNTILVGFIMGLFGQILAIAGLVIFQSPILMITGFVPVFFDNATIAVFANNRGGRKAAIILPFISGILQIVLAAVGVMAFGLQDFGGWYGNLDVSTVWIAISGLIKTFAIPGVIIAVVAMLAIPQIHYYYNKENYFNN